MVDRTGWKFSQISDVRATRSKISSKISMVGQDWFKISVRSRWWTGLVEFFGEISMVGSIKILFWDLDGGSGLVEIFLEISMVDQGWSKFFSQISVMKQDRLKFFSEISIVDRTGWKFFLRSLTSEIPVEIFPQISMIEQDRLRFSVRALMSELPVEIFSQISMMEQDRSKFSVRSRWWTGLIRIFL